MKRTTASYINLIAVILTIAVNGLAVGLPLNNQDTGAISDTFKVYFVPAGYVFSIWSVIYTGLIAFAIYQALPAQHNDARLRRFDPFFQVSCLANISWIFAWHYLQFPLSLVIMLVLLGSLIGSYLQLGIGRIPATGLRQWLVNLPMSIYLGWITVATIANFTTLLYYLKWDGFGIAPEIWTVIMLSAAVIIAALMTITRRDTAYLLVLVWAFIGIAVKHQATTTVATAAIVATILVGLLAIITMLPTRMSRILPNAA